MTSARWLEWTLTGVFAVCVALYGAQAWTAGTWQSRVAWSLHVLMALAMVAMAWPWGMAVSPITYVVVFTGCSLFFAYLGLFTTAVSHAVYHAVMMASMVVMAVAMTASPMSGVTGVGTTAAMPGMTMPVGGTADATGSTPFWVLLTCGTAAAFFVVAALRSFFLLVQGPQRPFANLLMTAGMGVSFAALVL